METWRPIAEDGRYEVSDQGRVRSLDMECWNGVAWWTKPGQVLRPQVGGRGYRKVTLTLGKQRYVHALVLEAFVGPCPEGQECLHANDNRSDNRLSNLAWGTHTKNISDAVTRKRFPKQQQTSCIYGHRLQDPNLANPGTGNPNHRKCKACNRARGYVRWHPELDFKTEADRYYRELS